ncbi:DUF4011 domain-containing protein [Herbiconiux sp. SYSU D00978]|uniref:DUF4011 domain-containing protein n=1 Tax=Herbiconiux sp. SYSU D00978 TaxID=2812562 RepID=UPI001A96484C|nr:DUF4011 domain-containing protein [Herbiconiux sp. SYSU D00978]
MREVYEVLEQEAGGLALRFEVQGTVNHALVASGVPAVRALSVTNTGDGWLGAVDFGARLVLDDGTEQTVSLRLDGPVPPGARHSAAAAELAPLGEALLRAGRAATGTVVLGARTAGAGPTLRVPVAVDDPGALPEDASPASLATLVTPGAAAVEPVLRAASRLLADTTGDGRTNGYADGAERAPAVAAAIFETLRSLEISHVASPAAPSRVRLPDEVLRDRLGTSLDLALLYAGCLEAAGLDPVLFLADGGAFTGFATEHRPGALDAVTGGNTAANLVATDQVVAVEVGALAAGRGAASYPDAVALASSYFRAPLRPLDAMVDVARARLDGVRPVLGAAGRPASAPADTPELVRGVRDGSDPAPARVQVWKRDLLDLTLRNPLLNLPRNRRVLDLAVPDGMLPALDDVVHSGKSVRLGVGAESSELQRLAGVGSAHEVATGVMTTMFQTTRTIYSTLTEDAHRTQLRAMKREADTLEQETGSNYLYLGLGVLVHTREDGREARAPLFLLPVRLSGGMASAPFSMQLDGSELAEPNLCLLEWLRATKGVELDALAQPLLDEDGLAVQATFAAIRRQLLEAELPFRIEETACLAILRFPTFQIWKDLDAHWPQLLENRVVRHLVERPGETFHDPAAGATPAVDEGSLRLPIAADGSQLKAIVRATAGESFVLEGPPGTGKSQTITNLIAHALDQGRTVLFVAEKQAALDVVARRLDAVGLGAFALELHGPKQSTNSIRDQLRKALAHDVDVDEAVLRATDARLRRALTTLTAHPAAVHAQNARGYSLWSAYDAAAALGDGPVVPVPPAVLASADGDPVRLTDDLAAAATAFGLTPAHPWVLSGATDAAALDPARLSAALGDVAAARARVDELSPAWRSAVASTPPGALLGAVVGLLGARDVGLLPERRFLPEFERSTWHAAADDLKRELADYRERHADTLALATPAAIELEELDELIERAAKLDDAWFLPGLRRRGIRRRLEPLLADPATVPDTELTTVLRRLADARREAQPLLAARDALPGLLLPMSWRPYAPGADEQLTAAAWAVRALLRLERHAPDALALVADASATDAAALRDLDGVWGRLLAALGATSASVRQWCAGRDWLDAWRSDLPRWQADVASTGALQPQRFAETRRLLSALAELGLSGLADRVGAGLLSPADAPEALLRSLARASLEERFAASGLGAFDSDAQQRAVDGYLTESAAARAAAPAGIAASILVRRPFDIANLHGEIAELKRQLDRKRGGLSFRELTRRYPGALTALTPCFLMSPGSVAHFLDATSIEFDLVVFDEASQIRVPQAIGSMGRAKSVVVVGDSKQMPPTRMMQLEAAASPLDAVEDLESILDEAVESGLPRLSLEWHYRSRDESLIAFSNAAYYDGRLVTLPAPGHGQGGLSLRRLEGMFDRGRSRTNQAEAQAVVDEVTARLSHPSRRTESIGVVCFNVQQRDLILTMLEDGGDPAVQRALTSPDAPLFVKNLENVQGDERDVILFSLAFSVDPDTGLLPLNFGPLNLPGGERRLNVAITRARNEVVLFSSFDPQHLDLARTSARGLHDLRKYLDFAADRRLEAASPPSSNRGRIVAELATELRDRGYEVETDLGLSSFRVDLAARRPGADAWRVAVLVDGPLWASRPTVADRDGAPALLGELMGWPAVVRVWLPGWMRDPEGTIARITDALDAPLPTRPRRVAARL